MNEWLRRLLSLAGSGPQEGKAAAALSRLPAVGEQVPDAVFACGVGGSPPALRGRPVLLAIWSSACPAAWESLDALSRVAREGKGSVVVLATQVDPRGEAALKGRETDGLRFMAGAGPLSEWIVQGGRQPPTPAFLLIDSAGRVAERQVGIEAAPEARLRGISAALDRLMDAP